MTTDEFKQAKPEMAHLEGNDLWNAMENYMLRLQSGNEVIRTILPFYKRYKLRKLYYFQIFKTSMFVEPRESSNRCSVCKKGVSYRMIFLDFSDNGDVIKEPDPCPHCHKPYVPEPNTNLSYRAIVLLRRVQKSIKDFLNWTCLVGSNTDGRYGVFGDETKYYVQYWTIDTKTYKETTILKKRKWWEYIIVKK